jgi:hypothetical protein
MNLLTSNAVTKTIAVGSQTLDRWKVETGLMSRKEFNARANERLAGLNAPRETIGALEFPSLNKTLEEMKQFFGKARARVEVPQIPNVGGLIDKNKVAEQAKLLETNVPFWKNLPDFERNFKKFGFAISANDEPVKMMIEKFLDGKIAIGELSKNIAELNIKTIAENEKMAAMNKANPLLANAAFWNTWGDWTKGLAENGFVISTNNERVRGLIDAFKGGRMAFGDFETQMMQLNSKTEVAKRGIDELSRATLKELATPLEAFNTALQGLSDQSKTLQKQIEDGLVDGQDRNKAAQALNRRAGKLIQDLLSQNQVGDSFIAGRAERGSAAAIETVLRNRFSDRGMEVQERIAAAINRQEILQKEQLKMQDKLIDAVMRVKPGTLILQGK